MSIALCTHPTRCEGMEAAHSVMAGQLANALAEIELLKRREVIADSMIGALQEEVERLRPDTTLAAAIIERDAALAQLATARGDVEMYMRMFEQASKRKAVTA